MNFHVFSQICRSGKRLFAHGAFVGSFARVAAHVCLQIAKKRKRTTTDGALKRFITVMHKLVISQTGRMCKRFRTNITCEWTFTCNRNVKENRTNSILFVISYPYEFVDVFSDHMLLQTFYRSFHIDEASPMHLPSATVSRNVYVSCAYQDHRDG